MPLKKSFPLSSVTMNAGTFHFDPPDGLHAQIFEYIDFLDGRALGAQRGHQSSRGSRRSSGKLSNDIGTVSLANITMEPPASWNWSTVNPSAPPWSAQTNRKHILPVSLPDPHSRSDDL